MVVFYSTNALLTLLFSVALIQAFRHSRNVFARKLTALVFVSNLAILLSIWFYNLVYTDFVN